MLLGAPADPVLRAFRLLVLLLWPTTLVWTLPGLHRPGAGLLFAWALVVLFSVSALVLLAAGRAGDRVLPYCLALFTCAAVAGAMAGTYPDRALLVPMFLGVLSGLAALRLSPRATWVQVGVSTVAGFVCIVYAVQDPVVLTVASVAVATGIATPALAILRLRAQLDAAHDSEHRLARTDTLTGLLNRRGLFEAAADVLGTRRLVDVITLDLDGFKRLNDEHGHAVGDEALRAVGTGLLQLQRPGTGGPTLVARLGGEEFLVMVAAGSLPLDSVAETVRSAATVSSATGWRTSASVGAVRGRPPEQPEDRQAWLLRQVDVADELMYAAKRSGGDRVMSEVVSPGPPCLGAAVRPRVRAIR